MTKKPSAAAARRLAAAHAHSAQVPQAVPDGLARLLDVYVPLDMDRDTWQAIRGSHREILLRSQLRGETSFKRLRGVVAHFLAYRQTSGLSIDTATALTYLAIDDYYRHGTTGLDPKTKNDYRSRLRALACKANPGLDAPSRAVSLGHQSVKPPYAAEEEAAITRYALRQRHPATRRQMCIAVGLCGGAGGDSVDLRHARRHHIEVTPDGIIVNFPGPRPRRVVVRRSYEALVFAGIEGLTPGQLLIGTAVGRNNIVASIVERAELHGAPHIEASRLRTTWLAWLMTRPVPLNVILDAAGLTTARTLCDLLPYLPASDPAALRDGNLP